MENPSLLLGVIAGILIFNHVLDQVVDFLNYKNLKEVMPDSAQEFYTPEKYTESIKYQKTTSKFAFLTENIGFIISFSFLILGGFGWIDQLLGSFIENKIILTLVFFLVIMVASDLLTLPFQLYSTFVIEEKFGFNTTTKKIFFTDKLKGYLLSVVIGGLLGSALIYLILALGTSFWIVFSVIIVSFMLFVQLFYSSLILPLFNKLSPLEEGELKSAILAYAEENKFSLSNIFVIDGSKRSKKANAFFMGLGKRKKIVLYDTLIQNHTIEELVAVLAHEMGHYKKKHIISGMVLSILQITFTLFVLSLMVLNTNLSVALGAQQLSFAVNLIAFGILYSPISKVTGILMNIFSRKNEYEADHFAKTTYNGKALASALKKLSADNLSNLYPHPATVFLHYSHPPLLKRLEALEKN